MKLLDPVTIPTDSSGNPQPFSIALPTAQRPSAIKLSNQSPWLQGLRMAGYVDWLESYTADVYPVPPDAFEARLEPRILVPLSTQLSAQILPVLAYAGERFSGAYPMALPRQSSIYAPATPVATVTIASGIQAGVAALMFAAGTIYLTLLLRVTVGIVSYTFVGAQSLEPYLSETLPVGGPYLRYLKLNPADSSVTVTNNGPGTLAVTAAENIDSNGPAPPSKLAPPDWQVQSSVNGSGTASVNSGLPPAGQQTVLQAATFSVAAGAARVFLGRVWDGASGTTLIGGCKLGSPGSGAGPITATGTVYLKKSTPGNILTFDFDFAALAGEHQSIDAGGYFE